MIIKQLTGQKSNLKKEKVYIVIGPELVVPQLMLCSLCCVTETPPCGGLTT